MHVLKWIHIQAVILHYCMSSLLLSEVIVYTVVFIWIVTTLSAVYINNHYLFDIPPLLICQNAVDAWGHSSSFYRLLFWTVFDGLFQLSWNRQIGRKLSKRERKHCWNMLISQIIFSRICKTADCVEEMTALNFNHIKQALPPPPPSLFQLTA